MGACRFCGESVSDGALKCQKCGEPQGWLVWPAGMLLRYVPLASAAVALLSLGFAITESLAAGRARAGEAQAVARQVVAEDAVVELAQELPEPKREEVIRRLDLAPDITLQRLEEQAQDNPDDVSLQRKAVLFRALREPNRPSITRPR